MKNLKGVAILLTSAALISSCSSTKSPLAPREAAAYTIKCPTTPKPKTPVKGLTINAEHVFCGEINTSSNAVGFHSAPGGNIPSTVTINPPPPAAPPATTTYVYTDSRSLNSINRDAIFTLENFTIKTNGKTSIKLKSSMFPSSCSADQVIASIGYAADNSRACKNTWQCGPSAPKLSDIQYCYNNTAIFNIQMGFTGTPVNTVNTAFPDF